MTTMTLISLLCLALLASVATRTYFTRARTSLRAAESALFEIERKAEDLLQQDLPVNVARVVIAMVYAAGCGCFVRAMLLGHYLPRRHVATGVVREGNKEIETLNLETREKISELMMLVIIYDSFRNPLQGWLFRRILKEYTRSSEKIEMNAKWEARLATMAVVDRKMPELNLA